MFYNPYLVVPFVTWLIAQFIKFVVSAIRGRLDFRLLYASGGMPSAHSAVVCSLALTALLLNGPGSFEFGLTALFAAIVMYDSFGVRRSSGEQAAALNMLIQSLDSDRVRLKQPQLRLREVLGHSPLQVTIGAFLGLLISALFNLDHLSSQLNFVSAEPVSAEFKVYLAVFAILVVGGFAVRAWLLRRHKGSKAWRAFSKKLLVAVETVGWLGLVLSFSQYEHLTIFDWRVWSWVVFLVLVPWCGWLANRYRSDLLPAVADEAETARKRKWLTPSKRRKR